MSLWDNDLHTRHVPGASIAFINASLDVRRSRGQRWALRWTPVSRLPPTHPTPAGATMTRKGFTLIELLIVIVIIGILAAIAIPKFANTKSKAYVTAMKSDLRNLVSAEESLFSDSARYTANVTSLGFKASTGVTTP